MSEIGESNDGDDLRSVVGALVSDTKLLGLRTDLCRKVTAALRSASTFLYIPASIGERREVKSLAIVVEMCGDLASGTVSLYEGEHWYAGSALVRQLIECEYLLSLFGVDSATASAWLDASPKELRTWWSPSSMRERSQGRFDDREYWDHCERGGHPVPSALPLLHVSLSDYDRRFVWIDFAVHLKRVFEALEDCFETFGFRERLSELAYEKARLAILEWANDDPAPGILKQIPRMDS